MQTVTNGVTMPSFKPLSTFSARRIRAGTRLFSKIDTPTAASVGATMAPIDAGDPTVDACEEEGRSACTQRDGEGKADAEQAQRGP